MDDSAKTGKSKADSPSLGQQSPVQMPVGPGRELPNIISHGKPARKETSQNKTVGKTEQLSATLIQRTHLSPYDPYFSIWLLLLTALLAVIGIWMHSRNRRSRQSPLGREYAEVESSIKTDMKYSEKGRMPLEKSAATEPDSEPSIVDRLVSDRPLEADDPDHLRYRTIAAGISRFLRNEKTEAPLTLAIQGRWGTGKSSIMSLLKADLERSEYSPIWFNAWHHQREEHFLSSLLENLRITGFPPWWTWTGFAFRSRLVWIRTKRRPGVVVLLCILVAIQAGIWASGGSEQAWQYVLPWPEGSGDHGNLARSVTNLPGLAALFTFLVAFQQRFRNTLLDPAKLAVRFSHRARVTSFRAQLSFRHRFTEEFRDVAKALAPLKIVILIDDVDRCRPDKLLGVLETVNFLVTSGECYVVMAMDRERVLGCVAHSYGDVAEKLSLDYEEGPQSTPDSKGWERRRAFAQEYLEKLVNIEVPVPELQRSQALALLTEETNDKTSDASVAPYRKRWVKQFASAVALVALVGGASFLVGGMLTPEAVSELAPKPAVLLQENAAKTGLRVTGFVIWLFLLCCVFLALTYRYLLTKSGAILDDSPSFREALEIWFPLIVLELNTPRRIKRFLNRLRYLAMCVREGPKAGHRHPTLLIPEPALVALATLDRCLRANNNDALFHSIVMDDYSSAGESALTDLIISTIAQHRSHFGSWSWPPKETVLKAYDLATKGVHVPEPPQ